MSFIVYLYFIIPLRHQSNNQRINTIRNESIFDICHLPEHRLPPLLRCQHRQQGDGFFIGDAEPEEPAEVLDPEKESEKKETAETERRIASLQENLDEADVTSEYGIKAPELHELLEGKKASLFKPEINVIRNVL